MEEKEQIFSENNEDLIKMYEMQDIINQNFNENKTYGFDLDIYSFLLRCRYLKPQIYGLRLQAFISTLLKYKTTPSSLDCGDFKTRENEDVEFKCSFMDKIIRQFNVKQVRPWQELDWYYVFTVDFSDYRSLIYKCYKLTNKQMKEECELMGAKAIHSTKKSNENNENIELGFTVKLDTEHFLRWEANYLNKKLDLEALSQERLEEIKTHQEYTTQLNEYKTEIERLKENHPEEILKRKEAKDKRIAEIMKLKEEYAAKVQKRKDAYRRKREKAFNKIPRTVIDKHYNNLKNGSLTPKQYSIIMDFEIVQRYVRRKRKIELISDEIFSQMFLAIIKRYYSKETTYEMFCEEFHKWFEMQQQRTWIKRKNSLKESIQFQIEEPIEVQEETEDEYFNNKMKEARRTSVY